MKGVSLRGPHVNECRRALVCRLACVMIGTLALAAPARAQGPNRSVSTFYADFSDRADAILRSASSHVREQQWAEAVDLYQRVIQQFGDKVARLPREEGPAGDAPTDSVLYVDLRRYCQMRLASLPAEARALYRSRVDAQAERWYRQGESQRDAASLRRVIDQAFCSSWGDDAAELLGDLAFQEGRFEESQGYYRLLVGDAAARSGVKHPDPSIDLARVEAKLLFCQSLSGTLTGEALAAAVRTFTETHPKASGALAGREGAYAEILAEALRDDSLAALPQADGRWPTFAGAATRSRVVSETIDVGSLQWRVELEPIVANRVIGSRRGLATTTSATSASQRLGYHPIVLGDQVIVCDESKITAYNLNDRPESSPAGRPGGSVKVAWRHDDEQGGVPQAPRFAVGLPRYTLTARGDRIYARMGLTSVPYGGRMGGGSSSFIVALDRRTDGKLLWKKPASEVFATIRPAEGLGRNVGFEGTPVADERRVYVALTERREQTATYVACLEAETGAPLWIRYLGAAASDADNGFVGFGMGMGMGMGMGAVVGDFGHRLLSLDGSTIYYQTNLGAVAALDAETGSVRWVATYPRQERNTAGRERDLNPAIVHDGLVIVAPDDASSIHAFDTTTGKLAWKTAPIPEDMRIAHLLGVAQGRLVATGDRVLLFDVKTGKLVHAWPDNGHGYEGFGRGLLAGDKIYWPTRNEIHVLDQVTGLLAEPPIKLQESYQTTGGNLAVGDGYLIVAQADQLVAFCQNRRLIQRYREEIARHPEDPIPHYRHAQAAEATGQDDLALASFANAASKGRASDTIDGQPLLESSRDQTFRILMKTGLAARRSGNGQEAERRFQRAAEAARVDRDRLRARLVEAETQADRGLAREAVSTLQRLLSEERLRSVIVTTEDGTRSLRADLLITDGLAAILRRSGDAVYAEYESRAKRLLERGIAEGDPRLLEEVARAYPVAGCAPDALLALGDLLATRKQPSDASRAYKRLLMVANTDSQRARALLGVARAYEDARLWTPARDAFVQALGRFPSINIPVAELATELPLATIVTRRLGEAPFDRMDGDRAEPRIPVPLARRWNTELSGGPFRPIAADGVPPSPDASRIFLARDGKLQPAGFEAGSASWTADLGSAPVWVGYLDDRVVAATASRVVALDLRKGSVLWTFGKNDAESNRPAADPFKKREGEARTPREAEGALSGFRIMAGRLFVLRGDRELVALDGDTGLVAWSLTVEGTLNRHLLVGPERTVAQTRQPNAVVVVDTSNGRRRATYPEGNDSEEWSRAPLPLDDDRVVIVPDRRTIALLDLTKGNHAWLYRESKEMPKNGPPRLLGDAERLLLLHDGNELVRLDAATGTKKWSRPLGIEDLSERPDAIALDGQRVYWASNRLLIAATLADGSIAWSAPLTGPESGWSLELTRRSVLAYPSRPRQTEAESNSLPLVFRAREDGALVQRLRFSAAVDDVVVRLVPGGALVATQGSIWALGARSPMDARGTGR